MKTGAGPVVAVRTTIRVAQSARTATTSAVRRTFSPNQGSSLEPDCTDSATATSEETATGKRWWKLLDPIGSLYAKKTEHQIGPASLLTDDLLKKKCANGRNTKRARREKHQVSEATLWVKKTFEWARRWQTTLSIPVIGAAVVALIMMAPTEIFFTIIFVALAAVFVELVRLAIELDRDR